MTVGSIVLQDSSLDAPISNDIAVALVLNLNVLLLVVMVLLVLRNLVKLYFERRGQVTGARFQTRLVVAFLAMTLIPASMMFAVATELISDTVDKWLNKRIERTLHESLEVAEGLYKESKKRVESNAIYLSSLIKQRNLIGNGARPSLDRLVKQKQKEYSVDLIQVYNAEYELVVMAGGKDGALTFKLSERNDVMAKVALGEVVTSVDDHAGVNMAVSVASLRDGGDDQLKGVVVVANEVSRKYVDKVTSIGRAYESFNQLTIKKEIIKASYQVTLALVALVIIFSAIWIAFYLAKGITVPLKRILNATEAVAAGRLDVVIDVPIQNDEVGQLVVAFNRMTHDLKVSSEKLEKANINLSESNVQLYHRGQYMEAVLDTAAGGVISIDKGGAVNTINGAAATMLGVEARSAKGANYKKVFAPPISSPIRQMMREMDLMGGDSITRELEIPLNDVRRTFRVSVSVLRDQENNYLGAVLVFDDLTEILAAQRGLAWREMSRVVAHEIKNPLTPIQLNVQRLRRKFEQGAPDFPQVFNNATVSISQEVDQLKALVERFSRLARLSDAHPSEARLSDVKLLDLAQEPSMLHAIIEETVKLYEHTRPGVKFTTKLDPSIKLVNIDTEQIKRVFINLVENAIDAINGGGEISIRTGRQKNGKSIVIEVADTGQGMTESVKRQLFRPYFSTKPKGFGLGLAIVSRIVEDHGGKIRVGKAQPKGTVFTIELPAE